MSDRRPLLAALAATVIVASGITLGIRGIDPSGETLKLPSLPVIETRLDAGAPPRGESRVLSAGSSKYATSKECPEMDNPGGLEWKRSDDPGPFPTDGRTVIPSLGVDVPIVKVRVGQDGTMAVPKNARDVAWLDQGGIPGKTKNVVLAGHINYAGAQGSFARIAEMRKGDKITVAMKGKHYKFKVTWNCAFPRDTPHAEQIMGKTYVPSVTLISCGGTFDQSARTHNKRIAVRAEMYSPAYATPKPGSPGGAPKKPKATPSPTPRPLLDLRPGSSG